jgi:uncharacterized protein (UPF0147 family)
MTPTRPILAGMRPLLALLIAVAPASAARFVAPVKPVKSPVSGATSGLTAATAFSGTQLQPILAPTLNFHSGLTSWQGPTPEFHTVAEPAVAHTASDDVGEVAPVASRQAHPADLAVPNNQLGSAHLGANAQLGGGPQTTADSGATGKNLQVGSGEFSAAINRMAEQTTQITALIDEGGRANNDAEVHAIGLSIFDSQDLWRQRPPTPKRSSNGWDWEVPPGPKQPLGNRNSHETYSRALVNFGVKQDLARKLVRRVQESHRYGDDQQFHGPLFSIRAANVMTQMLDHIQREQRLGVERNPTQQDKAMLVIAALTSRMDGYSGRPKGTSPEADGTSYFLKNDPYLTSIISAMRNIAVNPETVLAWVRHSYAEQKPYRSLSEQADQWSKIDGIYRRGFGAYWGERTAYAARVAMFVDSPQFARDAVRARARELRRDAEEAGQSPGPSDAEVFVAAAAELKTLTENLLLTSLPKELQTNLWAVRRDLEQIAQQVTQAVAN